MLHYEKKVLFSDFHNSTNINKINNHDMTLDVSNHYQLVLRTYTNVILFKEKSSFHFVVFWKVFNVMA